MNYSYNNGQLTIICNHNTALEFIQILTQIENAKNPIKNAMQRGFKANGIEISNSMLLEIENDPNLPKYFHSDKKLSFVKRIKEITGLGLKEAKFSTDHAWMILKKSQDLD